MKPLKATPPGKRLGKKARRGFRGYPIATIAYYGPDDRRASKVVLAVLLREGEGPVEVLRWHSETGDVRDDRALAAEILAHIARHEARTVVRTDRIIGCPHEEGVDYEGPTCPMCPFWANRDRWTGEIIG
jgi:hypothetical protein